MLRELARISSYNKSYFWTKQVLQVKNYYAVECSCLLSNNYLKHTSTTNQNSHFDWHEGDEWNDRIYTKKCFYTKPTLSAVLHYKVGPGPSPNMQPRATILFCYFSDQLICVQKGGGTAIEVPLLTPSLLRKVKIWIFLPSCQTYWANVLNWAKLTTNNIEIF